VRRRYAAIADTAALVASIATGVDDEPSPGAGPDLGRRFGYALTYDRGLVLNAARSLLHWIVRTA
jgi:hypothetical protein